MGEDAGSSVHGGFLADSYTLSFFSGWLWAAPGVTGSQSNGGCLTDAYFQPWMLHIKKIDGMDSGRAGDKLLGCESLQWVCHRSVMWLLRRLQVANCIPPWLKCEGRVGVGLERLEADGAHHPSQWSGDKPRKHQHLGSVLDSSTPIWTLF